MPCSRINTAVCVSWRILPRKCGNSPTISLSKAVCRAVGKRTPKNARMRAETEKFVADIPRHIPGRGLVTPNFQAAATGSMKFGIRIGGVNEYVSIDNKHLPSPFHHVVQGVAIGDIDEMASAAKSGQGTKFRFRPDRKSVV